MLLASAAVAAGWRSSKRRSGHCSLLLAIAVALGVLGNDIRRFALRRRGWRLRRCGVRAARSTRRRSAGSSAGPRLSGQAETPAAPAAPAGRAERAARRGPGDRPLPRTRRRAMTIAIIDYGAGNLHSVGKALELAAARTGKGGDRSW